jgi:hypothetical protein
MVSWLESDLERVSPDLLGRAIVLLWRSMQASGEKPSQEEYYWRHKAKEQLIGKITWAWVNMAIDAGVTVDDDQFPFSDEYILELWMKFRKLTKASKEQVFDHFKG